VQHQQWKQLYHWLLPQDFNAMNFAEMQILASNILDSKGQNVGVGIMKSQPLL